MTVLNITDGFYVS